MALAPRHYPDFERFAQLAETADLVPVYRRLVGDSLTPVSAFHKLDAGRCACLFESVIGGEKVGRYSFLATHPFFEIEAYERRVTINSPSGSRPPGPRFSSVGSSSARIRWMSSAACRGRARGDVGRVAAVLQRRRGLCGLRYRPLSGASANAPADDRQVPDLAFAFYDQMSCSTTWPKRSSWWRWPAR